MGNEVSTDKAAKAAEPTKNVTLTTEEYSEFQELKGLVKRLSEQQTVDQSQGVVKGLEKLLTGMNTVVHGGLKTVTKHTGRNIKGAVEKATLFLSLVQNFTVYFSTPTECFALQFAGGTYTTDDEEEIAFLQKHEALGSMFWEKEIPEAIITAKKNEEAKYVKRQADLI